MNSGSLRVWERLPPSKNSYVIISLLHWIQLRKLTMFTLNYALYNIQCAGWTIRSPGDCLWAWTGTRENQVSRGLHPLALCSLFLRDLGEGEVSMETNKRSNQEKKEKTFLYNIWRKGNFTQTSQKTSTHKKSLICILEFYHLRFVTLSTYLIKSDLDKHLSKKVNDSKTTWRFDDFMSSSSNE